jgi:[acyl-carrier-protein] S-malonyltransferase
MGLVGDPLVGLLFPGQGSQFPGMGFDLCSEYPEARRTFEEADDALGFALSRLCFEGPEAELTRTHNAQPAILAHSVAVHRVLGTRLPAPRCAAGHSLGEYSAYVAAGALEFGAAMRVVRRRGELMLGSGDERPGAMAAVLGLDDEAAVAACREAGAEVGGDCVAANYNSPGQLVISGDVATVDRALELVRAAGARRAVRLNVSGAFHSPLMKVAEAGLAEALAAVEFRDPSFAVVSNVTAEPVGDADRARELLTRQLTAPVRWTAVVRAMIEQGARVFYELGPGNVLTGLLRRIDRGMEGSAVGTVADVAGFRAG